jgi:apolipoprotein D and lipocalin family protein
VVARTGPRLYEGGHDVEVEMAFRPGMTLFLAAFLTACSGGPAESTLETVPELDARRYMGTWHDIADFPQGFQRDCQCTKAQYSLTPQGDVAVRNSCRVGGPGNPYNAIVGRAWIPDVSDPGKLKVAFFSPVGSDYWVIERGINYEYAVVSDPNRDTLWILSREPTMERGQLEGIKSRLRDKGFDLDRLEEVSQEQCVEWF